MGKTSVLMLATTPESLAAKSGFTRLVDYVENAELLGARRSQPNGNLTHRAARLALSQLSITSWYQLSSARLEYLAWKRVRDGFTGVLHVLWGDSDLGYLDLLGGRNVTLCATFHGCPDTLPQVIRHPERLRKIEAITVVSRTQSDFFVSHGVAPEKITFLPHGIDVNYFHPGSREHEGVFTVLAVGSYRRNFQLLREICDRLRNDQRFRFEIVSSPKFRPMFENLTNVRFRSALSDDELRESYRQASCLLMTVEASTANNALMEAMACGLPVITERIGGIPEYVNARCAIETAPGEVEPILAALGKLRDDPELAWRMSEAARANALSFSWENVGAIAGQFYRKIRSDSESK